ncbi:hypothetical protein SAMN05892883_1783 [Jatrophihabitans sp. GAS493]|nr:hypothetical protein SAMN05892883_1783 [Jatrophihabitans sp. GAS493]
MADYTVDAGALAVFGKEWGEYGSGEIRQIAPYCRTYAGQSSGMTGLLAILQPATTELATLFSEHYGNLARVYTQTGRALTETAELYVDSDAAAARKLHSALADRNLPARVRAERHEHSAPFVETSVRLAPTHAAADPTKSARSKMDIDVKAIDWLFNKVTGHHITEPIDALVGNWTVLTAQGQAWANVGDAWKQHGSDTLQNTNSVHSVWTGSAQARFAGYGHHLGGGMSGEREICLAIKVVLDRVAQQFEAVFKAALGYIQSVIHQVEVAAGWLAAGWWCGVGEAVAAKKVEEALVDFYNAWKLVHRVELLVKLANAALKSFQRLKDIYHLVANAPAELSHEVEKVRAVIRGVGAIPGELSDLSKLPAEPTTPYVARR